MKIVLFIVMFLLIGAFFIISNSNLHMGNPAQRAQFAENYHGWFVKIVNNSIGVSGYVIKMDWLPSSQTG